MTSEEEKAFELDLKNDKTLRDETEPLLLLAQVMREEQMKKDEITIDVARQWSPKEFEQQMANRRKILSEKKLSPEDKAPTTSSRENGLHISVWPEAIAAWSIPSTRASETFLRISVWSGAIAAVIALVFFVPTFFFQRSAHNTFSDYYLPLQDNSLIRGDGSEGDNLVSLSNYVGEATGQDLKEAIRMLKEMHEENPVDSVSWYLALAYIKDKQIDEARTLLKNIAPDSQFGKQAKELIDRLDNQNLIIKWGSLLDGL